PFLTPVITLHRHLSQPIQHDHVSYFTRRRKTLPDRSRGCRFGGEADHTTCQAREFLPKIRNAGIWGSSGQVGEGIRNRPPHSWQGEFESMEPPPREPTILPIFFAKGSKARRAGHTDRQRVRWHKMLDIRDLGKTLRLLDPHLALARSVLLELTRSGKPREGIADSRGIRGL